MTDLSTYRYSEQVVRLFEKADRYFNEVKTDLLLFFEKEVAAAKEKTSVFPDPVLIKRDEAYRMVIGYVHLICPLSANKRINEFLDLQEYLSTSFVHFELLRHVMNRTEELDDALNSYTKRTVCV